MLMQNKVGTHDFEQSELELFNYEKRVYTDAMDFYDEFAEYNFDSITCTAPKIIEVTELTFCDTKKQFILKSSYGEEISIPHNFKATTYLATDPQTLSSDTIDYGFEVYCFVEVDDLSKTVSFPLDTNNALTNTLILHCQYGY